MSEKILSDLKQAINNGDAEAAKRIAQLAVDHNIDLIAATNELSDVMLRIGEKFSCLEIFLSQLMLAGDAMKAATDVFGKVLAQKKIAVPHRGKIVIGTVQGDIHDIGKNLTAAMLEASGFQIVDLGVDVMPMAFIKKAEDVGADIIALSALMTTTRPFQKETVRLLKELGIRTKYKIIVGGGAASSEWAEEAGADTYARDCNEAVKACEQLLSSKS